MTRKPISRAAEIAKKWRLARELWLAAPEGSPQQAAQATEMARLAKAYGHAADKRRAILARRALAQTMPVDEAN